MKIFGWLTAGMVGAAVALAGARSGQDGLSNVAAVAALKELQPAAARCAPLDAEWTWSGSQIPAQTNDYVRLVLASLNGADENPPEDVEQRDPRLVAWFQALWLARQRQAAQSLPYLRAAGVGRMLLAAGHRTYRSDPACSVFNWLLAHKVGPVGLSPDPSLEGIRGYVGGLLREKPEAVKEAYVRLLGFDPDDVEWRLTLAKAHLALGELSAAEEVLQPMLALPAERPAAEALLQAYRAKHP